MAQAENKTHGGARLGAGRKRIGSEVRVSFTTTIAPATRERINALAAVQQKSAGQVIDDAMDAYYCNYTED